MTSAVVTAHGTGGNANLFVAPNWLRPVALVFVAALHAIALLAFVHHAARAPKAVQSVSIEMFAEDRAEQTNRAARAPETFSQSAERASGEGDATKPPNENSLAKLDITTSPSAIEQSPDQPLREIERPTSAFSHDSLDRGDKPAADKTTAEDRQSDRKATSSDVDRDVTTRDASEKAPDATIDLLIPASQARLRIKRSRDFKGVEDVKGRNGTNGISAHLFRKPKPGVATSAAFHNRQATLELHRNAVGALVGSDGVANHIALAGRSAVGSPPAPAAVPATNPAPSSNNAVAAPVSATSPGSTAPHFASIAAVVAQDNKITGGAGLARPGASAGAIGGAPKIVGGIISGNSVHLKRP